MHAKVFSATTVGVNAHLVEVEVDAALGLPNFFIVGLPDAAIRESSKRVRSAIKNSGIKLPAKVITVNLAPADLKKEGALFDLPIAVGIICASGQLKLQKDFCAETIFLGEMALDGTIRPVKGVLPIAYDTHRFGKKRIIVPKANAQEASMISGLEVIGVSHLTELIAYLRNELALERTQHQSRADTFVPGQRLLDFSQVKGQWQAKRALQVCAAGGHNIVFIGPPGSGKTMLAKRLPTIMPKMTFDEMIQTSKIYSISGKLNGTPLVAQRPFRDPHHTISQAGLVGGGSFPQPGEISLAHNGILFLDELTEFKRTTLEVLRQPLEGKKVSISRAQMSVEFPASFLLVAALNPCPCGFFGDKQRACVCSPQQVHRYLDKLSGPLLDRIDIHVRVDAIDYDTVTQNDTQETSSNELRIAVTQALAAQHKRFGNEQMRNAFMRSDAIEQYCVLTNDAQALIKKVFSYLQLSVRGYHKILKTARTIADLAGCDVVDTVHVREAVMYRSLDRVLERTRQ